MKIKWGNILKKIKLVCETITAVAPVIKIILVASGMFALVMVIGDMNKATIANKYADAIKKNKQEAKVAMVLVEQYKHEVAQLQNKADSIKLQNTVLLQQVIVTKDNAHRNRQHAATLTVALRNSANTIEDSVEVLIQIVPIKDSIIANQDAVISKQDTVITNLNTIIENKDLQIKKLQVSVTSLESVVKTIPVYDACEQKFLFCKINKPSRRTSLVVGFTVGVLTTGILLR